MTTDRTRGIEEHTTMTCQQAEPLIARAADGTLDAARRAALDRHLAACAACRDALDGQRAARAVLAARPAAPVPPDLAARVMAQVAPPASAADRWLDALNWRAWTLRLAPVAGALVVGAALGGGPVGEAPPLGGDAGTAGGGNVNGADGGGAMAGAAGGGGATGAAGGGTAGGGAVEFADLVTAWVAGDGAGAGVHDLALAAVTSAWPDAAAGPDDVLIDVLLPPAAAAGRASPDGGER